MRALCIFILPATFACSALRPITASPSDFADYQRYARIAEGDLGKRLAAATGYLSRQPDGAFASELRAAFERDELAYFEAAKGDRDVAIDYLAWLPAGPHAAQVVAIVGAFDTRIEDTDERGTRLTEEALVHEKNGREAALSELGNALAAVVGSGGTAAESTSAVSVLVSGATSTWGATRTKFERALPYVIPAHLSREPRALELSVAYEVTDGVISWARVSGPDLFLRWAELDMTRAFDARSDRDRAVSREHAIEALTGLLEARFPASSCATSIAGASLARACNGVVARVTLGGEADEVLVQRLEK